MDTDGRTVVCVRGSGEAVTAVICLMYEYTSSALPASKTANGSMGACVRCQSQYEPCSGH